MKRNSELKQFWIAFWRAPLTAHRGTSGGWFRLTTDRLCASLWSSLKWIKGNSDIPSQGRKVLAKEHFWHLDKDRHFQSVTQGLEVPEWPRCPGRGRAAPQMILSQQCQSIFFHSFVVYSTGFVEKTTLEHNYLGHFFSKKLFCFYSTCLNGKSANNLGSWRCVKRSVTPLSQWQHCL